MDKISQEELQELLDMKLVYLVYNDDNEPYGYRLTRAGIQLTDSNLPLHESYYKWQF